MFTGFALGSAASTPEQRPKRPQAVHLERPHELCGGGLDSATAGDGLACVLVVTRGYYKSYCKGYLL